MITILTSMLQCITLIKNATIIYYYLSCYRKEISLIKKKIKNKKFFIS